MNYCKIIAQSKYGRIMTCEQCRAIHIHFDEIRACLSQRDFELFEQYVAETLPMYYLTEQDVREVWIPFSNMNMCLLSFQAIQELHKLIKRAQKQLAYLYLLENVSQN